jgi:large subunit ribosomal protein L6
MSKIGKRAVSLPSGVTAEVSAEVVTIKGPKGLLSVTALSGISVNVQPDKLEVVRANDERQTRANHGLMRSLLQNAVSSVTTGYAKTLKLIGTGYRVAAKGKGLQLSVGFSHPVDVMPLSDKIVLRVEGNDTIQIDGIDKQLVGQMAANIRGIRPPEAYKGKGIRYIDEHVKLKPGKTAGK